MKIITQIEDISVDEINLRFQTLDDHINEIRQKLPKAPTEYLTRQDVAEMLKCDLSTIHNWVKKGKLIPYGIGNRVYFKLSDIELALKPLK